MVILTKVALAHLLTIQSSFLLTVSYRFVSLYATGMTICRKVLAFRGLIARPRRTNTLAKKTMGSLERAVVNSYGRRRTWNDESTGKRPDRAARHLEEIRHVWTVFQEC